MENKIIQRSNAKSFFLKLHYTSQLASKVFNDEPKYKEKPIEILQIMCIEDGELIIEVCFCGSAEENKRPPFVNMIGSCLPLKDVKPIS